MEKQKTCKICGVRQDLTMFSRKKTRKGRSCARDFCKPCEKKTLGVTRR